MSKAKNPDNIYKPPKDNRLYFSLPIDNIEVLDGLKNVLNQFITLELISKIDGYILNNSKIIYVKLSVDVDEKYVRKLCKIIYDNVPDSVKKITYKGVSGYILEVENPLYISKKNEALSLLDAMK